MVKLHINVLFCEGIKDLKIEITPGLCFDDVIHKCVDHIRHTICIPNSRASSHVVVHLPLFGLRLLDTNGSSKDPLWLPHWHTFSIENVGCQLKEETYEFRVRHKPIDVGKYQPHSVVGEYMFLQAVQDFLKDPAFPVWAIPEHMYLLLLSIALLVEQKELPLGDDQVVDQNWETPLLSLKYFLIFPRWLLSMSYRGVLFNRLTFSNHGEKLDSFRNIKKSRPVPLLQQIVFSPFPHCKKRLKGVNMLKRQVDKMKGQSYCFLRIKTKFIETMFHAAPRYCQRMYSIKPADHFFPMYIMLKPNKERGLYYENKLECGLSEIEEMKLVNPTNLLDKKWTIQVCLKDGGVKDLPFDSNAEAESFLSMAQIQMKLCVRWDCFLSYDTLTRRERLDLQLKSFGPLYDETAKKYLKELTQKPAFESRGFLIHQSTSEFDTYIVVSCVQTVTNSSQTSGVSEIDDLQFEHHQIVVTPEGKMQLIKVGSNGTDDGSWFWNQEELSHSLLTQFGLQAQPRDYSKKAEINEEYKRDMDEEVAIQAAPILRRLQSSDKEMPNVFLSQDLKDKSEIKDKNIKIRKYRVIYKNKPLMMVRVASPDQDDAKAFLEGLERLENLRRGDAQRFLELHKPVLGSMLTRFVTELPSQGDLLTYICNVPQSPWDKVHLMRQVVATLLSMHEMEHFHGNIRSRKFLVFDEPSSQSVRLKLEFPGVTSLLDTKPIDDEFNVERLAWLSPERRENLANITYESECYAVGTTLAEILYRSDDFAEVADLKNNEEIPPPPHWFSEGTADGGEEIQDEMDALLKCVWELLVKPCWNTASCRPLPNQLMADFVEIIQKASNTNAKEVKEKKKELEYGNLGAPDFASAPSVEQLRELLQQRYKDFIPCENLVLEKTPLGSGYYGTVWKGKMKMMENTPVPFGSSVQPEERDVAVKMMHEIKGYSEESFRKEISIAAQLRHENVLELLMVGNLIYENREQLVLVSEYMDEETLKVYLSKCNKRKYQSEQTLQILKGLCSDVVKGMVYLSGKDIVHRDLAPRNVLLKNIGSGQLRAKVSDFGLSRILDDDYNFYRCRTEQAIPWPQWPPECLGVVCLSESLFTTKGDVWSFGILLWMVFHPQGEKVTLLMKEAIRERNPKDVTKEPEAMKAVYQSGWRPERHQLMPQRLYNIMETCWEEDPKKRPPFVELEEKLDALRL
ncbi:tyrosine-protein kinase receptor [Elysia marginata]|uniref:Tyrosine-protein kinase receptor n=1 Tax=Elysia marginata TaxID=1093978 RepID=A0AAV4GK15_9GAST|nr:tyrosine-protein kinase receptor [Elysia marginata]